MYYFLIRIKGQEVRMSGLKSTGMGLEITKGVSQLIEREVYLPEMAVGDDRIQLSCNYLVSFL